MHSFAPFWNRSLSSIFCQNLRNSNFCYFQNFRKCCLINLNYFADFFLNSNEIFSGFCQNAVSDVAANSSQPPRGDDGPRRVDHAEQHPQLHRRREEAPALGDRREDARLRFLNFFFSRAADEKLPRKRRKEMNHGKTTLPFGRSSHCRDTEGLREKNGATGHRNVVVGIHWAMTTYSAPWSVIASAPRSVP